MTIAPIIHNNGTAQGVLIQQIGNANVALDHAIDALADMAPNPRDYYLTGNFTEAKNEHQARVKALLTIQAEIIAIGENIADQPIL